MYNYICYLQVVDTLKNQKPVCPTLKDSIGELILLPITFQSGGMILMHCGNVTTTWLHVNNSPVIFVIFCKPICTSIYGHPLPVNILYLSKFRRTIASL